MLASPGCRPSQRRSWLSDYLGNFDGNVSLGVGVKTQGIQETLISLLLL